MAVSDSQPKTVPRASGLCKQSVNIFDCYTLRDRMRRTLVGIMFFVFLWNLIIYPQLLDVRSCNSCRLIFVKCLLTNNVKSCWSCCAKTWQEGGLYWGHVTWPPKTWTRVGPWQDDGKCRSCHPWQCFVGKLNAICPFARRHCLFVNCLVITPANNSNSNKALMKLPLNDLIGLHVTITRLQVFNVLAFKSENSRSVRNACR